MSTSKRLKPVNNPDTEANKDGDHFNKPEIWGCGTWFCLHTLAVHATTPEKIDEFIENLKIIISNLRCLKCKEHASAYVAEHPLEPYKDLRDKNNKIIGMQKYIWQFHNNVNTRLQKPLVDWETAYAMYNTIDVGICASDCGSGSTSNEIQPLIPGEKSIAISSTQKAQRVRTALIYGSPQTLQKVQTGFRLTNGY